MAPNGQAVSYEGNGESKKPSFMSINSEELRKHDKVGDLWISIEGKVYDVTDWLTKHPGGENALKSLAGQDVTDAFLAFHPGTAWSLLPQFQIGVLTDYEVSPIQADYRKLLTDLKRAGLYKNPLHVYGQYLAVMIPMFVLCVLGVVYSPGFWIHIGCGVLMGFFWIQAGFMGHDIAHSGMFKTGIDKYLKLSIGCFTGIGMQWWRNNHNAHHYSCNCVDYDPDIQYMPLFAITPKFFASLYSNFYERKMDFDAAARFLVSYQHYTFYIVMALARINLYAQTLIVAFTRKMPFSTRAWELGALAFYWSWFSLLLSCLPNNYHRLAFVLSAFATTGIQHVQFVLNHFSSPVYEGRPESKTWFESQVRGSLNISSSPWTDWFHGGLNFQIDHHVFPTLPRHNLRKVAPFVKPLCDKYDLPYESVSWWEANLRVLRTLKAAAMEARDISKPAPSLSKSLIWEAANARG
ncbi:protein MpFAD13 [Marchantia polymorpha subsp. ruderalis]|uniref:Cytochrome b5 heme-binding domain-containing protein n=2 Tax=Marchantia polymorpha TaxID=3197 RepID=A0AAF6BXK0_MARPO|nr:putative desaturase [Marchantia polymorpha]PTQ35816.1 hypothetical protein MARPO_0068s0037 [Marchantia polymorpha]PTQ35817.1 hypothetical protein MARPO_0068s0037 [Marchantia polymorpha]BBN16734.1 hypothetical protein Mp_7g08840 [Marchantia polymorpha subsp. ruderalis]BBN16735.1 hypothetical protein Mp_7g08840 [Marchantia polymorpha subsp. ruderalis]|eukprot:PTQ35816.1 hypothetical protein MARPO_0068s0037 [Marchantia polymorpha]